MPRRLQISLGKDAIQLLVIHSYAGVWEDHWKPIQYLGLRIPVVPQETFDQALIGWTKPLVSHLGYSPKSQLILLPKVARQCRRRHTCPLYRKEDCTLMSKTLPWCYEPEDFQDDTVLLVKELIDLWREGVHVIVVDEEENI